MIVAQANKNQIDQFSFLFSHQVPSCTSLDGSIMQKSSWSSKMARIWEQWLRCALQQYAPMPPRKTQIALLVFLRFQGSTVWCFSVPGGLQQIRFEEQRQSGLLYLFCIIYHFGFAMSHPIALSSPGFYLSHKICCPPSVLLLVREG